MIGSVTRIQFPFNFLLNQVFISYRRSQIYQLIMHIIICVIKLLNISQNIYVPLCRAILHNLCIRYSKWDKLIILIQGKTPSVMIIFKSRFLHKTTEVEMGNHFLLRESKGLPHFRTYNNSPFLLLPLRHNPLCSHFKSSNKLHLQRSVYCFLAREWL